MTGGVPFAGGGSCVAVPFTGRFRSSSSICRCSASRFSIAALRALRYSYASLFLGSIQKSAHSSEPCPIGSKEASLGLFLGASLPYNDETITNKRASSEDAQVGRHYSPECDLRAFLICSFTSSMLKLAPLCIGGNSMKVFPYFSTSCCT